MEKLLLPQIVAIGIYNTQIAIKNRTVTKNRKTSMFEIELSIGNGGISYSDDDSHPISENLIICAKPGQIRHTKLPYKCYYVHAIVNEGVLFDMLSSLPNYIETDGADGIREIFISLCEHSDASVPEDELLLQSLLLKLIYLLAKKAAPPDKKYRQKPSCKIIIEETIRYIKENLSERLTTDVLAERANFSEVYFHKLFKASTGKNLREFIEEERIKKAINLLISTNKTLTRIAYECGFSSQSYFSYAFKKKKGSSPREYAKKILLKYENAK